MAEQNNPKNLAELKAALDRGDYKGNYVEIKIDNDSVYAQVFEDAEPDWESDELEPIFDLELGFPGEVLEQALKLLGFENAEPV